MVIYLDKFDSPIGLIQLVATDEALVYCANSRESGVQMDSWIKKYLPDYTVEQGGNHVTHTAKSQLQNYLAGESQVLDMPLNLIGTDFRKTVWKALQTIPYGETRTYGEIATQIGKPKAARAVGQANHHNPISYFVPWHRVIGAGGDLVGFGGGLDTKSWLLSLEGIEHKYRDKQK